MADNTRYFIYSQEHVNEKNRIEATMGREFVCGQVYVGNKIEEFSYLSKTPTMDSRYPDAKIVASGDPDTFRYTKPYVQLKRGV